MAEYFRDTTTGWRCPGCGRCYSPTAESCPMAEVEMLVPTGELDPDAIHTPGIYVDRIVQGQFEKRIEQRTTRKRENA